MNSAAKTISQNPAPRPECDEQRLESLGFYLFSIDQGRFVQLRRLADDSVVAITSSRQDALELAAKVKETP